MSHQIADFYISAPPGWPIFLASNFGTRRAPRCASGEPSESLHKVEGRNSPVPYFEIPHAWKIYGRELAAKEAKGQSVGARRACSVRGRK